MTGTGAILTLFGRGSVKVQLKYFRATVNARCMVLKQLLSMRARAIFM